MPNFSRLVAQANLALLRRLLPQVSAGDRSSLARTLMQDRFDPATGMLAEFCQSAVHAWKNRQYDISLNGEESLLARLAPLDLHILLDVGANKGSWTRAARQHLPEADVHAFEIDPDTARILSQEFGSDPNVVINVMGLGESNGEITIYASPESSTATSTLRHAIEASREEHRIHTIAAKTARIVTGDAYMRSQGLARIDLLKIDVEGAEFAVLRGFTETFAAGLIDVVQFEYGKINLATRCFLADFHQFFAEHGYVLGKLFPEGVVFKPYDIDDEDFVGPNFIACREGRRDIIDAVSYRPGEGVSARGTA